MKKWLMALALVAVGSPAFAADSGDRLHLYLTGDYYLKSGLEEDSEDGVDQAVATVPGTQGETTSSDGFGGRLGLMRPIADGKAELGVTGSYVVGPEIENVLVRTAAPTGRFEQTIETTFIRVMIEGAGRVHFSDNAYLRLGAGAGVGQSKVENNVTLTGSFPASGTGKEDATGFTWEVSPALCFLLGSTSLEIGVRYAVFPKIDQTNETPEIDWKPFGFYAGLQF